MAAPPPSSPRRSDQPSRPAPSPPRSAPIPSSLSSSSSNNNDSNSNCNSVEDVQAYFRDLGASDESLQLLRAEQVDGKALRLFTQDELRDNFKLSLGVLKKHAELSGTGLRASHSNSNMNEIEEAERGRLQAEREAEEARRLADRNADTAEHEQRRRIQAEKELAEAKR